MDGDGAGRRRGGTSTPTTASRRRADARRSACRSRGGRRRTRSTRRCAPTSTGGSATATCGSSAATVPAGSPRPVTRPWPPSTASSTTGSAAFGPHEDAVLAGDPWMAHSLLSAPLNLGLLDPLEVVEKAEDAYRRGDAPLQSVEGFVRQVMGWRDYVWHIYWHEPPEYRHDNRLERPAPPAGVVRRARRRRHRGRLPAAHPRRGARPRLGAPHPAADDPRGVCGAAGLAARRADRLVPPGLRRRVRLGHGAQRRRHVAARRRRDHGHQALRLRRGLPRPHDRPLRRLPVRPEDPGGRRPRARSPRGTGGTSTATASASRATSG